MHYLLEITIDGQIIKIPFEQTNDEEAKKTSNKILEIVSYSVQAAPKSYFATLSENVPSRVIPLIY